jgi:hypothetical protein
LELQPHERRTFDLRVTCHIGEVGPTAEPFDASIVKVLAAYEEHRSGAPILESSNVQFNDWIRQSQADLHMLLNARRKACTPLPGSRGLVVH